MPVVKEKLAPLLVRDNVSELMLLVATKKGAFIYYSDGDRRHWDVNGPHFLGSIIHHLVLDPRDNKTLLMAARTGHLGPTVFRSKDFGKTWQEASKPPVFPKDRLKRSVHHIFWLTHGHESEADVWYAGTSPQGLFRTEDGGDTWDSVDGFNKNKDWKEWTGGNMDGTPNRPKLHSILIDPRNPEHMYIALSHGGTFESTDKGDSWLPLNRGVAADFIPEPHPKYGHDPHCMIMHPDKPDRIYQQNHCGIYRIDRPIKTWSRIGDNMPADVGDIGFPIVVHPADPDTIWVFPMDGTEVWPRVSPDGQPAVYCSQDAGDSWFRQDIGLPMRNAWFTVLRQAMAVDRMDKVGVYLGNTNGSIWMSDNEGNSWRQIVTHLPKILAVEMGIIPK